MEQAPRLGCVILAAGNSSRFGSNKLTALWQGRTLFQRALDCVPEDVFFRVAVVTQYPELEREAALRGFSCVRNDRPELGISHSVRLGTEAMQDCGGILFLVADQPLLQPQTLREMAALWQAHPTCILSAVHGSQRGSPNLFPARFFPELTALQGDRGGGQVLRRHPEAVLPMEVPERELWDCDTPEALQALAQEQ